MRGSDQDEVAFVYQGFQKPSETRLEIRMKVDVRFINQEYVRLALATLPIEDQAFNPERYQLRLSAADLVRWDDLIIVFVTNDETRIIAGEIYAVQKRIDSIHGGIKRVGRVVP